MSNPYYNATGTPAARTKANSSVIRSEYASIEYGFDQVDATKANRAGDTFTGAVIFNGTATFNQTTTAPTVGNPADASAKVATTQFVQDALGASGAFLPPQAGHGGKALFTNGTVASWAEALPSQSGNNGKALFTDRTSASWQAIAAISWSAIQSKPTTLDGFGITNAQHAIKWRAGNAVVTAPWVVEFKGADIKSSGNDKVIVTPHLPHNLMILAGVH